MANAKFSEQERAGASKLFSTLGAAPARFGMVACNRDVEVSRIRGILSLAGLRICLNLPL
jgi:hypothetical protein